MSEQDDAKSEHTTIKTLLAALIDAIRQQTDRTAPKLFMSDAQIIKRIGIPENTAYALFRTWDRNAASQFPPKRKECGNRRYFPAVVAYFEDHYGLKLDRPRPRTLPPSHQRP